MRWSTRTAVAAGGMAALVGAGSAVAAKPHLGSLRVAPTPVRPGQLVRISGNARTCGVGDRVTIISRAFAPVHRFAGMPAVFTTVEGHDIASFHAATRIPSTRAPGRYAVTARCGGANLGTVARLTVRR
jgi:hypothetical protein